MLNIFARLVGSLLNPKLARERLELVRYFDSLPPCNNAIAREGGLMSIIIESGQRAIIK